MLLGAMLSQLGAKNENSGFLLKFKESKMWMMPMYIFLLKLVFFEKTTRFLWNSYVVSKNMREISQNFVAFSEYMNFF